MQVSVVGNLLDQWQGVSLRDGREGPRKELFGELLRVLLRELA